MTIVVGLIALGGCTDREISEAPSVTVVELGIPAAFGGTQASFDGGVVVFSGLDRDGAAAPPVTVRADGTTAPARSTPVDGRVRTVATSGPQAVVTTGGVDPGHGEITDELYRFDGDGWRPLPSPVHQPLGVVRTDDGVLVWSEYEFALVGDDVEHEAPPVRNPWGPLSQHHSVLEQDGSLLVVTGDGIVQYDPGTSTVRLVHPFTGTTPTLNRTLYTHEGGLRMVTFADHDAAQVSRLELDGSAAVELYRTDATADDFAVPGRQVDGTDRGIVILESGALFVDCGADGHVVELGIPPGVRSATALRADDTTTRVVLAAAPLRSAPTVGDVPAVHVEVGPCP